MVLAAGVSQRVKTLSSFVFGRAVGSVSDAGRRLFLRMEDISLLAAGTSFCSSVLFPFNVQRSFAGGLLALLTESRTDRPDFSVSNPLTRSSELIFTPGPTLTNHCRV